MESIKELILWTISTFLTVALFIFIAMGVNFYLDLPEVKPIHICVGKEVSDEILRIYEESIKKGQ